MRAPSALASGRLDDELAVPLRHVRSISEEPILAEAAGRNDSDTMAVQFTILMNRNPDYARLPSWLAPDGWWSGYASIVRASACCVWRMTSCRTRWSVIIFATPWLAAPERVYVSPLDCNVEHGVIHCPFNPMIRIAKRLRLGGT